MKFHFLGTTGYHPSESRHTACMMIPELGVVFDAGTGMFRVRDLIETTTLDIFLSHVHLDHVIGLSFLYDVLFGKEMDYVRVHVAQDKIEAIQKHLYSPDLFPVEPNFELVPLEKSIRVRDWTLNTVLMEHPGGCHGMRLEHSGGSLAYITDTTADLDSAYVPFIQNVDVLIHECYFDDGWEDKASLTGHSCLTPVAQVAAAASAGQTWLVHVNPLEKADPPFDVGKVQSIYPNLRVASDGQVIELTEES